MQVSRLLLALGSAAAVCGAPLATSLQQPWRGADKVDLRPSPHLPLLSFRPDGTFKLAIVTDTHLLDNQLAPGNGGSCSSTALSSATDQAFEPAESEVNGATIEEVQRYLERERPDFAVHNGDVIS
jgi:hypothetical protein